MMEMHQNNSKEQTHCACNINKILQSTPEYTFEHHRQYKPFLPQQQKGKQDSHLSRRYKAQINKQKQKKRDKNATEHHVQHLEHRNTPTKKDKTRNKVANNSTQDANLLFIIKKIVVCNMSAQYIQRKKDLAKKSSPNQTFESLMQCNPTVKTAGGSCNGLQLRPNSSSCSCQ